MHDPFQPTGKPWEHSTLTINKTLHLLSQENAGIWIWYLIKHWEELHLLCMLWTLNQPWKAATRSRLFSFHASQLWSDSRHVLNSKDGPEFFHLSGKSKPNVAQEKRKNPSCSKKWYSRSCRCPFTSCWPQGGVLRRSWCGRRPCSFMPGDWTAHKTTNH